MPKLVTATMTKSLRAGKVFLDWSQNSARENHDRPVFDAGARRIRPSPHRVTWEELEDPDLRQLRFDEVLERVGRGRRSARRAGRDGAR